MWTKIKEKFSRAWENVKYFFNRAWSIFLARMTALTGLLIAALSAADWGPIVAAASGAGFSRAQAISLGVVVGLQGVLQELARRHNTRELENGQLVPSNVVVKKVN